LSVLSWRERWSSSDSAGCANVLAEAVAAAVAFFGGSSQTSERM